MTTSEIIRRHASNLFFIVIATVPMVIVSENMFYYIAEPIWSNIFWYAFAAASAFWAIEHFSIRRVVPLFLAGAIFGWVVEGVLVPLIYGHPLFISWTPLAWHAPLSFMLLWYYFRKWSLENAWLKILITSSLLGLFWATWAIVLWLPPGFVPEGGEIADQLILTSGEFTLYAFTYGLTVIAAHLLLGFFWPKQYKPGKIFNVLVAVCVFGYFILNIVILSGIIWAPLYLGILFFILWIALKKNKQNEIGPSAFADLEGHAKVPSLIAMATLPIVASLTYWFLTIIQPSPKSIFQYIYEGYSISMLFIGFGLFFFAYYRTITYKGSSLGT